MSRPTHPQWRLPSACHDLSTAVAETSLPRGEGQIFQNIQLEISLTAVESCVEKRSSIWTSLAPHFKKTTEWVISHHFFSLFKKMDSNHAPTMTSNISLAACDDNALCHRRTVSFYMKTNKHELELHKVEMILTTNPFSWYRWAIRFKEASLIQRVCSTHLSKNSAMTTHYLQNSL